MIDWNKATQAEIDKLRRGIENILEKGGDNYQDIRLLGHYVLFRAKHVSYKVNKEVLSVISKWIEDEDMLRRHEIVDERVYDWAAKKREQRWFDRRSQAEALRRYWNKRLGLKAVCKEIGAESSRGAASCSSEAVPEDFLTSIVEPFTPEAYARDELERNFSEVMRRWEAHRVPWNKVVKADLAAAGGKAKLSELPKYSDDKVEFVARLQAVLGLESLGEITIFQDEPFRDPIIEEVVPGVDDISEKSRDGSVREIDVSRLSNDERLSLIKRAKNGETICL